MLSLSHLPFTAAVHPEARPAARLTWDSREAGPDTAFVALPGEQMHGNAFVKQALERGAPFVLTDLDVPRAVRVTDARQALFAWATAERQHSPLVIGITGSVGKTTAKSYAAAALKAHFMPVFNTLPAIACFLLEFGRSDRPLVVEMGIDRLGEMRELMDLVQPDVGVITSIGAAHLQAFGSVDRVASEKSVILEAPQQLVSQQAAAWFPDVDTYGFEGATFSAKDLRVNAEGAEFEFGGVMIKLPYASKVQAEAAVLGLALAQQAEIDVAEAADRLACVSVPAGRYRVLPGRFTVIDDTYNASPLSMHAALEALGAFDNRRISVLGRMLELGEGEELMHAEVGQKARQSADLTYGVGPFAALLGQQAYQTVPELLSALKAEIKDGDVILIKASRGISWTPQQRLQEGVGLDSVVNALLEWRGKQ